MIGQSRPRGRRLWSLCVWSLVVGLMWLLLGQQYAGQPAVHLDLTAALPGAATLHERPAAPARPAPAVGGRTSTPSSTGTSTPHSQAVRAVAFALTQRGKPHRWGAEGPDAYDCSGLVWLAWQHAGLDWPRMSAAAQWRWLHQHGRDVPAAMVSPGDLLFYANDPPDPASIHHVAMAIGYGRMVEAPAPGIPVRVVAVRWPGLFAVARPPP
jgi:cell wall-associated NlpC family hydrolase